jgi:hypothetical protein
MSAPAQAGAHLPILRLVAKVVGRVVGQPALALISDAFWNSVREMGPCLRRGTQPSLRQRGTDSC